MQPYIRVMRGVLAVLLLGCVAPGCRRSPQSVYNGYYCGRTADGRSVWFSLEFNSKPQHGKVHSLCTLHEAGSADFSCDEITMTNQTNISVSFEPERDSAPEGPRITSMRGHLSGKPAIFSGVLITSNNLQGIELNATNVAGFKHLKGYRGLELRGRGGGARYEATFPKFPGTNQLQAALNKLLAASARTNIHDFVTNGYDNAWTAWKERDYFVTYQWEGQSDVQISFISDNVLSLYGSEYAFTGGAHGNTGLYGQNFLFVDGNLKEFALKDLFRAGSDWKKTLHSICGRELRKQQASFIEQLKPNDIEVFTFDERGFAIHFAPYEVGSYAEGSFHVFVPWKEVRPLLDINGPAKFIPGAINAATD